MPLSVLCGPYQPSLEDALIDNLLERPPGPSRAVAVVAPSRFLSDRLQRLIAAERGLSFLNLEFHTFYSLARKALAESETAPFSVVGDDFFHDFTVDLVLRETGGPLGVHGAFRGLAGSFREALRDLSEAGVDPAQFREHFASLLRSPEDSARLELLLRLQELYDRRLERAKVLSFPQAARLAARRVQGGAGGLARFDRILYYGFYDLNGAQADFFQAVAERHTAVLFFPFRADHPAFAFAERFYKLKLTPSAGAPRHLPVNAPRALHEAAESLFHPGRRGRLRDPKSLRLISASGSRDEVWRVAKEILALRDRPDGAVPFHEIGVVARTLKPYRAFLPDVFRENGIPFSLSEDEPLMRHPIAKLCLSLLTLRRRDYPVSSVLDVIESPFFFADRFGGRSRGGELVATWSRLIARLGFTAGWGQWQGKISPYLSRDLPLLPVSDEEREGPSVSREDTAALWGFLKEMHGKLAPDERTASWTEHIARAEEILISVFRNPDSPAWEAVHASLEELAALDKLDAAPTWTDFLDAVEEKLRRAVLPSSEANGGVRVMNAMDARGEQFRVLFLIGLREGLFPRQVREDPLLRDPIRALLQQPAGYWIQPKLTGYDEEKLLFALSVSSVSEALVCIYPRSDEDGKALVPSIYLRELCRAAGLDFEAALTERVPRQPYEKFRSIPPERLSPKEITLCSAAGGYDVAPFLEGLGRTSGLLSEALRRVKKVNASGPPGAWDGIVGRPDAFLEKAWRKGFSPTALESLARCPFQFYASRVLGLPALEESSERGSLEARLKGTIYHRVLHEFHDRLLRDGYWRRAENGGWQPVLDAALDTVFGGMDGSELGLYPLVWQSVRRQMTAHLRRFAAWDVADIRNSGLFPSSFETAFKGTLGEKGIPFFGRLDRIDQDTSGRRFRVIDYKTRWPSSRESLKKRVLAMRSLQPMAYLELVAKSRADGGEGGDGAYFYALEDSPETTGASEVQAFPAALWRALRRPWMRNLEGLVSFVEEGHFSIAPEEGRGGVCEHCDYSFVCRKGHGPSRRRAEQSGERDVYDRLRTLPDPAE